MDIITNIVKIKGSSNPTQAILDGLTRVDYNTGEVVHTPTEGEKWEVIRAVRDDLLAQTDWVITRALERGESVPEEYVVYRERLRSIPQDYKKPEDVVFPCPPGTPDCV